MIEHGEGDILRARVDALVNAVNTVGVMGKGLALQFKEAFPEARPQLACVTGARLRVGRPQVDRREAAHRGSVRSAARGSDRSLRAAMRSRR